MSINPPAINKLFICTVLLYAVGDVVCTGLPVLPDINPTPPLEFPSKSDDQFIIKEGNVTFNNINKPLNSSNVNNDKLTLVDLTPAEFRDNIKKQLNDVILKSSSQPINVIAKVSENYTGNFIENTYYTNHIEESWTSITLTLIVLTIMATIILACSALCLKKVQNLKISKQQLLQEDCYDSVMSDLINVQHV